MLAENNVTTLSELLEIKDDDNVFSMFTGFINDDDWDFTHIVTYLQHILDEHTILISFTESECNMFSYNSNLLAQRIYSSVEMAFILEYMNGIRYTGDFALKPGTKYKVFDPGAVTKLFTYWNNKDKFNEIIS